jgi:GGDEF domain-containing protein
VISIRKTVNDLERVEQLRQLCHSGYIHAIRAAADYAIELDPAQVAELRQNLERIREQLENASEPEHFEAVQASLRGELRLYRDRSAEWLDKMSRELQASAMAMQSLAGSLCANGSEHEAKLNAGLKALASVQTSNDLVFVKKVTHTAATTISESWDQLRRANQVVTAQLYDEIRALHREIDNERRALFTDPSSGAWTREKLNLRIEDNLRGNDSFCLVFASITNLKRLTVTHSRGVIESALKALVKRVDGIVGKDSMIGRWNEDQFAVLLELNPGQAMAISSEIAKDLSAYFSIQENGVARSLTLRVTTSVVGRPLGGDAAHFREKLAMLDAVRRA